MIAEINRIISGGINCLYLGNDIELRSLLSIIFLIIRNPFIPIDENKRKEYISKCA